MDNKRDLMLNSALDILVEKGINSIRISEVARRANVGKGTVYEYFKSKDDLVADAVDHGFELCTSHIVAIDDVNASFQCRFDDFCGAVFDITEKGPFLSILSSYSEIPPSPSVFKKISSSLENTMNPIYSVFEDIIKKGVSEGVLFNARNELYIKSMLTIITNTAFHNIRQNTYDRESLKLFLNDACVKLFSE